MKLKSGDKVIYKNDPEGKVYTVYGIYSKGYVSLGLYDYPDTEQDEQIEVKHLIKLGKKDSKINGEVKTINLTELEVIAILDHLKKCNVATNNIIEVLEVKLLSL